MKWELYNLREDRPELNDLIEKFPERKEKMIMQFNEWSEKTGVIPKDVLDKK